MKMVLFSLLALGLMIWGICLVKDVGGFVGVLLGTGSGFFLAMAMTSPQIDAIDKKLNGR